MFFILYSLIVRLIDAFEDQIRTAVEKAITQKIVEGVKSLDSMLQKIPKEVKVDDVVSLNVTFVDDPLFGNSFIEFDIDGLFVSSNFIEENQVPKKLLKDTSSLGVPCEGSEMLGISLDQAVFNTASALYFQVICFIIMFVFFTRLLIVSPYMVLLLKNLIISLNILLLDLLLFLMFFLGNFVYFGLVFFLYTFFMVTDSTLGFFLGKKYEIIQVSKFFFVLFSHFKYMILKTLIY